MIKIKRGDMAVSEIIALILVIIVVIVFFGFLFVKDPILNWMKNLPGYNVNENNSDREIGIPDTEVPGSCYGSENQVPEIKILEGSTRARALTLNQYNTKQYIFIANKNTNLYWKGDEKNGEIIFDTLNLKVGIVENGIVKIDSNLLNPDNIVYQKARIEKLNGGKGGIDSSLISDLIKLNGTRDVQNFLCKTKEQVDSENTLIIKAWPESAGGKLINVNSNELKLQIVRKEFNIFEKYFYGALSYISPNAVNDIEKVTIVLPGVNSIDSNFMKTKKFSLFKYKNILLMETDKGNHFGIIYPDGSVWIEQSFIFSEQSPFSEALFNKELIFRPDFSIDFSLPSIPDATGDHVPRDSYYYIGPPTLSNGGNSLCNPNLPYDERKTLLSGKDVKAFCEFNLHITNYAQLKDLALLLK